MNLKNLTTVKLSDPNTYNLVHGILLINKVHKQTNLFLDPCNTIFIEISESVYDMSKDDVELLQSWNWNRFYYMNSDQTFWVFKFI